MERDLNVRAVVATHDGKNLNIKDSKEVCVDNKVKIQDNKGIETKEKDGMIV